MPLLSASAALLIALQAAPQPAPLQETEPEKEKLVCKSQTGTNTRFKKKTCMTRAQWDAIAEQNKRDYSESRDRPVIEIRRDN